MKIINLTPHNINLIVAKNLLLEIPASGQVARVEKKEIGKMENVFTAGVRRIIY